MKNIHQYIISLLLILILGTLTKCTAPQTTYIESPNVINDGLLTYFLDSAYSYKTKQDSFYVFRKDGKIYNESFTNEWITF